MIADLTVRPALIADVETMHAIRLAVRENRLSDPGRIGLEDYRPFVEQGSAWVAESGSQVVGFAAIDRAVSGVWALFVAPAAEGLGAGTALHDTMLQWARLEGLERLSLSTGPGTRAEQFYRRRGWTVVGRNAHGELLFEMRL